MKQITNMVSFLARIFGSLSLLLFFTAVVFTQAGRIDYGFGINLGPAPVLQPGTPGAAVTAIAIQPDGKILVAGDFVATGPIRSDIIRLNTDNTIDPTFNAVFFGNGNRDIRQIGLQSDGKIIVSGTDARPARLNSDGSRDSTFMEPLVPISGISDLKVQPDDEIILTYSNAGGGSGTIRLNADGSLDRTLVPFICGYCKLGLAGNNKVLIAGDFTYSVNQNSRGGLARVNVDGTLDTSFAVLIAPLYFGVVAGTREINGGKVLVWGAFTSVNGITRNGLAMLDSFGNVTSFNPDMGAIRNVYDAVEQPDGKIVFAGNNRPQLGGVFPGRVTIGRLNADGSVDKSWHPGRGTVEIPEDGAGGTINTIKIRGGNKLLVGGKFFRYNGVPRSGLIQIGL